MKHKTSTAVHARLVIPILTLAVLALSCGAILADDPAASATTAGSGLLPLNDNTAAPFHGIYRWGQGGLSHGNYDLYTPWLNRTVIWGEDFMPTEGWDKIEGQGWQMGPWGDWVNKMPGRRYILSVPILVGSWDGKGPSEGPAAGQPVSLEEGAKGTYNIYFKHLAESLVQYKLANSIIRVGWEFNGGWYIWRTGSSEKAKAYAAYFKQIVTTMRAVPGAENLKFCWNPAMEPWWPYNPEDAWPGDDVVDYVGVDCYDQSWAKDTYPIPKGATPDEALALQKATWENVTDNEQQSGLPFWVKFAAKHGKPLTIPEWGVCHRSDDHGGEDNAYYVEQMYKFIYNPANNVYFDCYFDVGAPDGDHQLCPIYADGNHPTRFPLAAAKYKELFSLPAGTPTYATVFPPGATNAPASTAPAANSSSSSGGTP